MQFMLVSHWLDYSSWGTPNVPNNEEVKFTLQPSFEARLAPEFNVQVYRVFQSSFNISGSGRSSRILKTEEPERMAPTF